MRGSRGRAWICVGLRGGSGRRHADPRFPPGLLLPLPLLKGVGFDSVLVLAHTDVDLRTRACIYFSYLFIYFPRISLTFRLLAPGPCVFERPVRGRRRACGGEHGNNELTVLPSLMSCLKPLML